MGNTAYLEDGTAVELLAMKGKIRHEDGTEGEAWVTPEAPAKEEATDAENGAAGSDPIPG